MKDFKEITKKWNKFLIEKAPPTATRVGTPDLDQKAPETLSKETPRSAKCPEGMLCRALPGEDRVGFIEVNGPTVNGKPFVMPHAGEVYQTHYSGRKSGGKKVGHGAIDIRTEVGENFNSIAFGKVVKVYGQNSFLRDTKKIHQWLRDKMSADKSGKFKFLSKLAPDSKIASWKWADYKKHWVNFQKKHSSVMRRACDETKLWKCWGPGRNFIAGLIRNHPRRTEIPFRSNWMGGIFVKVEHVLDNIEEDDNRAVFYSYYMHLDSVSVTKGDIQAGAAMGTTGDTGIIDSDPHLHVHLRGPGKIRKKWDLGCFIPGVYGKYGSPGGKCPTWVLPPPEPSKADDQKAPKTEK